MTKVMSAEFLSIPTTAKFTKAVKYIHDEKSWERCYVLHCFGEFVSSRNTEEFSR